MMMQIKAPPPPPVSAGRRAPSLPAQPPLAPPPAPPAARSSARYAPPLSVSAPRPSQGALKQQAKTLAASDSAGFVRTRNRNSAARVTSVDEFPQLGDNSVPQSTALLLRNPHYRLSAEALIASQDQAKLAALAAKVKTNGEKSTRRKT